MSAQVESIGQLERRIRISIPLAQIEAEVANRLKRIARSAKIHGFRPGKVPMKIVAQQYGGQVRQEVISEAGSQRISDTLREQQIKIAGLPRIEAAADAAASSEQLEFTATFEIYPEVIVGSIASAKIERPTVQVTEIDVDSTIDILRKQHATFVPVERAAQSGDQVDIDYTGTIDGQPFAGNEAKGYVVTLGEGRTLADFDRPIEGMQAGESKTFDMTFPADYHGKEVVGKTATFAVKVNRVLAPQLPEIGPELAQALGVADGDVAKMRAEVRTNIEREIENRVDNKVKEQVMQALIAATPLSVPRALIDAELERLIQRARQDLQGRGIAADDMPLPADLFEAQAQRRVTLGLILAEVVKANDLRAQPEQVRKQVEVYAESYEKPEQVVAWYYENPTRLEEVESLVLEQNVVSWVLKQAQVADKATPFDELMGIHK
jgi:trigger factor